MINSPLQLIKTLPPQFTVAEACAIANKHYGLQVNAHQLVSERDQNFRLIAPDGESWVLKIANADEDPQVTGFQIDALRHIARSDDAPPVPTVLSTVAGEDRLELDKEGQTHVARVVSWLDGETLDSGQLNAELCRNLGAFLARLGTALVDFRHAGGSQALLWDLRQAPALKEVLPTVSDEALRDLLAECLDDFAAHAEPRFSRVRAQVIHNDFNPDNILINPLQPDTVAGVIDFGDMQRAPLVIDVAVGASYLRNVSGDPLTYIAEFVAGYHTVTPLQLTEIDLLYDLISARLATTIAILAWRGSVRAADDSYLEKAAASEDSAAPFLRRLRDLPRADVSRRLRQVCASVNVQHGGARPA